MAWSGASLPPDVVASVSSSLKSGSSGLQGLMVSRSPEEWLALIRSVVEIGGVVCDVLDFDQVAELFKACGSPGCKGDDAKEIVGLIRTIAEALCEDGHTWANVSGEWGKVVEEAKRLKQSLNEGAMPNVLLRCAFEQVAAWSRCRPNRWNEENGGRDMWLSIAQAIQSVGEEELCVCEVLIDGARVDALVLRGTKNAKDILLDVCCMAVPFPLKHDAKDDKAEESKKDFHPDWKVHMGFVERARKLWPQVWNVVCDEPEKTPILVGHSMGAAVAAILAMWLFQVRKPVKCFCLAPPPSFQFEGDRSDAPIRRSDLGFIRTAALENDIVPRLSSSGLLQMLKKLNGEKPANPQTKSKWLIASNATSEILYVTRNGLTSVSADFFASMLLHWRSLSDHPPAAFIDILTPKRR